MLVETIKVIGILLYMVVFVSLGLSIFISAREILDPTSERNKDKD